MKCRNALAGLLLFSLQASAADTAESSFTQALAEAKRLGDTDAGKAYDSEFAKVVAPRLSDIVSGCTKNIGPKINFQVVFVFAADGRVQQVLTPGDQPAAACVGDKLRDLHLPAPSRAGWPVQLSIDIGPDNAPTLLTSALELMKTGTWEVDASISRGTKMRVHGLLAGEDFDLTLEPENRNAVRQISIKDRIWVSFDGSKTWKLQAPADQATFRRVYAFVHDPIRFDATRPVLGVADQQKRDGETWMHLRPKISDKKNAELQQMEYWIAINQDPQRNGVRRYEGPVTEAGHEKEPLHCVATYQPANSKTIQPPAAEKAEPTVSLLDGKLKIDIPPDFVRDPDDAKDPKTLAKFSRQDGAWGTVLRGTHGLTPDKLEGYLKMRVTEYSKGFSWLPKDAHLQWLRKEIVVIDGRKWADWRYVPISKGRKDYRNSPVYTRFLTTSYKGQLLEITFTTNLTTEPELKEEIDHIMDSVHLEE